MKADVTLYVVNYNYGEYLEQCLVSVAAQTLQPCEVLVFDNGSTDGSTEIIERLRLEFPDFKFIQRQKSGLIPTIKEVIKITDSKYIMRLDADDFAEPKLLECLYQAAEKNQNCSLCYPDYYEVDQDGILIQKVTKLSLKEASLPDLPPHGACTLMSTKVLKQYSNLFDDVECQDGVDMWLACSENNEVVNVNIPLFNYRQHGKNLTKNELRLYKNRNKIFERHAIKRSSPLTASILAIILPAMVCH